MNINGFDYKLTHLIQSWPSWLGIVMVAATFVGLPAVIIGLALAGAVAAWHWGQPRVAMAQLASLVALEGNTVLKSLVHRMRPDTPYAAHMKIKSFSFPSGHAFGAVVFYGLVAYLAHKYLPAPWNSVIMVGLIVVIVLIGLSRVYLGAHYPTDVLAGLALGSLALLAIVKVIKP